MRLFIAAPLLLLCACNVDRDAGNETTTLSFNEAVAQNTLEDVGETRRISAGRSPTRPSKPPKRSKTRSVTSTWT